MSVVVEKISAQGLGPADFELTLPGLTYLWGPTGAGKSHRLAALELIATGRFQGSPLVKIDQTNAGVMTLSRDGKRLSVSAEGGPHPWSASRVWTADWVPAPVKKGEKPTGELVPKYSQEARQTFADARTFGENDAAIRLNIGTLSDVWDARGLLSVTPGALRERLLSLAFKGGLKEWIPEDMPAWLRGDTHLAPEAWVRLKLGQARSRKSEAEAEVTKQRNTVESIGFVPAVNLDALAAARDRAVAALAAHDSQASRVKERDLAREQLTEIDAELVGLPDLSVAAAEEQVRAAENGAKIRGLQEVLAHYEPPATQEEIDAAKAEVVRLSDLLIEGRRRQTSIDRLRVKLAGACEKCGHVTGGNPDELRAEIARLQDWTWVTQQDLDAATDRLSDLIESHSILRDHDRLRALEELPSSSLEVPEARRIMERAREREKLLRRKRDLEARLGGLSAGAPPTTDRDELVAELEEAKSNHSIAATRAAEAKVRDRAQSCLLEEEEKAREAGHWATRLVEIQRRMLDSVRERITRPLSELTGRPCELRLTDARGREDCDFRVGLSSVSTLSTGEQVMFLAGMMGALFGLASPESCPWRPLVLDRMESVSQAERDRFVAQCREHLVSGVFDQVVLAGCHDAKPKGRFLEVTRE